MLEVAGSVGELKGTMQAVLGEMARMNAQLTSLSTELDVKHNQNVQLLAEHKAEDNANFAKIFTWLTRIITAAGVVSIVISAIWALTVFIIPLLMKAKLGE